MCLPKGKETWALPKNLDKAFDDYLSREGCLEDLFQTNPQEQYEECVNQNALSITTLSCNFYPATLEEHPMNNNDLHCVLFWKSSNALTLIQDLERDDIEGHLLEQLQEAT